MVPAHDEAAVIDRLLDSLLDPGFGQAQAELVVVANGCADDTAGRVRRRGLRVLELGVGSKVDALNAGDAAVTAFPRFYVDADIELSAGALGACAAGLEESGALVCAPRALFDDTAASRLVRAFYRHLRTTPYITSTLVGLGVYGLSEQGRARFGAFPALVADDLYVSGLFDETERLVVEAATFTVRTPRSLRALLAVRVRVYYGNAEMAARGAQGNVRPATAAGGLRVLLAAPDRAAAVVYYAVNALAKARARALARRASAFVWARDDSSRS